MTDRDRVYAEKWNCLMEDCGAHQEPRIHAFAQLIAAYSEPYRHYHNLEHIMDMLDRLPYGLSEAREIVLLELATWYHDVVYDPHRSDNENRSAEVARNSLLELGLSEDRIARVCELILLTKDHRAPPSDINAQFLLDADLHVLATIPDRYRKYANAIRQEYAWVPDREFYQTRRMVLLRFLERPVIFQTENYRQFWEAHARANISAEIAQIDEILKTLPP